MPDARVQSVVDAAERAAAAGDYASAEQFLREAALLLEASLGPLDPELANTLNNLGVVCEITSKPVEAEQFFRRASAIAAAALEPDHPFVATSRKNLEDFCEARGIAVDPPTPTPAIAAEENAPTTRSVGMPSERPAHEGLQPVSSGKKSPPVAIGTVVAAAFLAAFVGVSVWFRSSEVTESPPGSASASTKSDGSVGTIVEPAAGDPVPTTPAGPQLAESTAKPPAAPENRPGVATAPARPPIVAAALLCRNLTTYASDNWRCVPPDLPVGPGTLIFYTRIRSATDTTVQHRWYRGDRLMQAVELSIRANTAGGYRTYSRHTVPEQSAAEWKVELRTRDGVLLHDERFLVR
jgi:hypothetical protein